MKKDDVVDLVISFLDEKGFGVGILDNDAKVKVPNALPEEVVKVKLWKKKRKVWKADNLQILRASKERVEPQDQGFEAVAPWQIMNFESEQKYKQNRATELAQSVFADWGEVEVVTDNREYEYRNKIEWSFYADKDGLSLAFHKPGTKSGMIKSAYSSLLPEAVNIVAQNILEVLRKTNISKSDLKTLQIRYSFWQHSVVASLFVKNSDFDCQIFEKFLATQDHLGGLEIVFSNPKSPASVYTTILQMYGQCDVTEKVADLTLTYPSYGFFQVNPQMFAKALTDMRSFLNAQGNVDFLLDMYAGVGTIGIGLAKLVGRVEGIELFGNSAQYADKNIQQNQLDNVTFTETSSESSIQKISKADVLVVDPPRSGLHPKLNQAILQNPPKILIYLSCNPKTQVADVSIWKDLYECKLVKGYNFYPKTPHLEMLMCFVRK